MGLLSMKWLVLCSLALARLVRQPTVPVQVSGGLVRGTIRPDGAFMEYYGIPYATVVNRFQSPIPDPKWEGIFDAYEENIRCTQRFTSTTILGREDCLTVNVYTPREAPGHLLPVMVFIHGGGFRDELLKFRVPRKKGDIILSENIFVPCVEKEIPGVDRFLSNLPYNVMKNGSYQKVPLIYGFNDAEGYMFTGKENSTTLSNMNFYSALPRDIVFPTEEEKIATAKKLEVIYMGGQKITNETLLKFSKYEGDSSITYPTIATIDLLLKTSDNPLFAYKFCYDGMLNYAKILYGFKKFKGATHADELFYLFSTAIPMRYYVEQKFIDKFTELWANFAHYGDPTPSKSMLPKWEPADPLDPQLLVIDKELSKAPVWDDEHIKFWNETYFKYRRKT
ncbi:unnamed protein product [Arctia plantaginis]|uniref:Carboxylesterase type B domain-containing protein n=1 Tax=Arctia plantaginis TaxID=874455 RepID=A0A8S1AXI7_ARCPL|nr:unnamed protein product [Arctia plantaginis]